MKKFLFFMVLIIVGVASLVHYQKSRRLANNAEPPETISNPVYAEAYTAINFDGASFEQIILVEAIDQADCRHVRDVLEQGPDFKSGAIHAGQSWQLQSLECKTALSPRNTRLLENRPMYLTYLSIARGSKIDRETRMIVWGLIVEQSDMFCERMRKAMQERHKAATCIKAEPT
jgi:hypothetical protein